MNLNILTSRKTKFEKIFNFFFFTNFLNLINSSKVVIWFSIIKFLQIFDKKFSYLK